MLVRQTSERERSTALSQVPWLTGGSWWVAVVGTFLRTYSCPTRQETAESLLTNCAFDYLDMVPISLIGAHGLPREIISWKWFPSLQTVRGMVEAKARVAQRPVWVEDHVKKWKPCVFMGMGVGEPHGFRGQMGPWGRRAGGSYVTSGLARLFWLKHWLEKPGTGRGHSLWQEASLGPMNPGLPRIRESKPCC